MYIASDEVMRRDSDSLGKPRDPKCSLAVCLAFLETNGNLFESAHATSFFTRVNLGSEIQNVSH
jgi:hypothetical protein